MKRILSALAVAAVAAFAQPASAGTASTTFTVTAVVSNTCSISAANIGLGAYDPLAAAPLTGTGSVTVACTVGAIPAIQLDNGAHYVASRAMSKGAGTDLAYELYSDAGYATRWGSLAAETVTLAAAPSTAARATTVYARVPAGQQVAAGTFTDTVTATVNF